MKKTLLTTALTLAPTAVVVALHEHTPLENAMFTIGAVIASSIAAFCLYRVWKERRN